MKVIPGKLYELIEGTWMELPKTATWLPRGTILLGWPCEECEASDLWHKFLTPDGTVGWLRVEHVKEINHNDSD